MHIRARSRALLVGAFGALAQGRGARVLRSLKDAAPVEVVAALRRSLAPLALGGERPFIAEDEVPLDERSSVDRSTAVSRPEVSIVVPTCGSTSLAQCVAALAAFTEEPACELVLVDDASDDTTTISMSQRSWPSATIVRSEVRRGFPASINAGARAARGSLLVLLNDDVVVTPGWLDVLRAGLARADVALAGPSTNQSGDEAEVLAHYRDLQGLLRFAKGRRGRASRSVRKISLLCALVRREAFDEVSGLDEGYGLGIFEDDELCASLRARGWTVVLAEGAFVHHHGSRSFGRLDPYARARAFERSRERFESRWGRWTPMVR